MHYYVFPICFEVDILHTASQLDISLLSLCFQLGWCALFITHTLYIMCACYPMMCIHISYHIYFTVLHTLPETWSVLEQESIERAPCICYVLCTGTQPPTCQCTKKEKKTIFLKGMYVGLRHSLRHRPMGYLPFFRKIAILNGSP